MILEGCVGITCLKTPSRHFEGGAGKKYKTLSHDNGSSDKHIQAQELQNKPRSVEQSSAIFSETNRPH
jgi:hypothetical protein